MGQGCIRREGTAEAAPEAVRQAVEGGCQSGWGGYCRLKMPLKLALGVRETVAGHRLGALEGGGSPPLPMHPWGGGVIWGAKLCQFGGGTFLWRGEFAAGGGGGGGAYHRPQRPPPATASPSAGHGPWAAVIPCSAPSATDLPTPRASCGESPTCT